MRLAAAALLLAACSQQPADLTIVTSDEDRQLNEAADSLAANMLAAGDSQGNDQ